MLKTPWIIALCIIATGANSQAGGFGSGQSGERLGAGDKSLDRGVSIKGELNLVEVFEFLKGHNVNFVVAKDSRFADGKVQFNIQDKPLRDFMEAVAVVFEGEWIAKGDVYILVAPQMIVSNGTIISPRGRRISEIPSQGGFAYPSAAPAITFDTTRPDSASGPRIAPTPTSRLWSSLSHFQRSQIASVGYLKLGQLNKNQQQMIGNPSATGKMTTVQSEGHSVKIKLVR